MVVDCVRPGTITERDARLTIVVSADGTEGIQ